MSYPPMTRTNDLPRTEGGESGAARGGCDDFRRDRGALHRLRRGDELIERLAPPIAEAHAIVRIAILLVLMHGKRGVFRSLSVRLHRDDRGEGRDIEGGIGRPVA